MPLFTLRRLLDVNVDNPTDGDHLVWNAANNRWQHTAAAAGGSSTFSGLTDTDISGSQSANYTLRWNGTDWVDDDTILNDGVRGMTLFDGTNFCTINVQASNMIELLTGVAKAFDSTTTETRIYGGGNERINVKPSATDGVSIVGTPLGLNSYTVAGAPSASNSGAGAIIYVSDETGGATLAFSDGTDWRRVQDRAVIA